MRYADSRCKITEIYNPHRYVVTGEDVFTNTTVRVYIPAQELFAYRAGAMIQDAMPSLNDRQREFLISGMYDSFPGSEPGII